MLLMYFLVLVLFIIVWFGSVKFKFICMYRMSQRSFPSPSYFLLNFKIIISTNKALKFQKTQWRDFSFCIYFFLGLFNIVWLRAVNMKDICKYKMSKRILPAPPTPTPSKLMWYFKQTSFIPRMCFWMKEVVLEYLNTVCAL